MPLAGWQHRFDAVVASSQATAKRLKALGLPLVDLTMIDDLPLYIDGADEINAAYQAIKGGGGALTQEKLLPRWQKSLFVLWMNLN